MKKMTTRLALIALALALALSQIALAEPSDTLKAVYEALIAEDSGFSQMKATYAEYFDGVSMDAALKDDGITITLDSKDEYVESGSWTFTEDGDFLTISLDDENYIGYSMATAIMNAAATVQGVSPTLFNAYISSLGMTGGENRYFVVEDDEAAGTMNLSINIVGPYELDGLDGMVLTEETLGDLGYEAMGEEFTSTAVNFGKVSMIVNGSAAGATFLVMEYDQLDDIALADVTCAAKVLQPKGWEDFIAGYTELRDADEANYTARLNVDEAAVRKIIEDPAKDYSYAIFTIGQAD